MSIFAPPPRRLAPSSSFNRKLQETLKVLDKHNISEVDHDADMKSLFPGQDTWQLMAARKDPRRYLHRLTNYPDVLLNIMYITDTSIVGNRATEFFVPGTCSSSAKWYLSSSGGPHMVSVLISSLKMIDFRMVERPVLRLTSEVTFNSALLLLRSMSRMSLTPMAPSLLLIKQRRRRQRQVISSTSMLHYPTS